MAANFNINDIKQELFDVIVKEEMIDNYTVNEHVVDHSIEHDFVVKQENMFDYDPIPIKLGKARKNSTTISTTIHPAQPVNMCDCTENNVHQLVPAPRKYHRKTDWGVHPMTRRSQSQNQDFMVVIKPME